MKKVLSAFALLCVFAIVNAQFQNTYDLTGDDYANKSVVNSNGEIISVGSSNFAGAGGYDAMLMKVDSLGNFIWQKQYGGTGTEYGTMLTQVSDGFAIAGFSTSFSGGNQDILLIKTDLNGDLQWAKTYGSTNDEYATYVSSTMDGGFILTGETKSYGNGGQDAFLLKTDASGNVDWFKAYGSNSDDRGYYVVQTGDTGYAMGGLSRVFVGAGQNDAYFLKTDSIGNIQLQFLTGGSAQDEAKRFIEGQNKLIVAGNTGNDIFVGEFNIQSFNFNWFNTYGGTGNDGFTDVIAIPEGYVVTGFTSSFGSTQDGLVFLIDTFGRPVFNYLMEGASSETIQNIAFTNKGGLVTGFSNSFGGTATDVYLTIIGDNDPCFSQHVSLTATPQSPSILGPNIPNLSDSTATVTGTPVTLTQSTTTATTIAVCNILDAHAGVDGSICGSGGGQAQIGGNPSATGGAQPYTYAWSPSTDLDSVNVANPIASPTATTTYTLIVTDSTGATATESVTVFVGPNPTLAISATDASCFMNNDGTAKATVSDGTSPYSYEWSNGSPADSISRLIAGTYYLTVTDAIGCSANDSVVISQPTFVSTFSESTASSGNDGTATVHAHGGTPPYTYDWDTNPVQHDSIATGLAPGIYNVTVRDANGCSDQEHNINVPSNPQALSADAGNDATICDTTQVHLGGNPSASGGSSPYTYLWSPVNGLDDSNAANPNAAPTSTITYTLVVTDSAGATASDQVTITVNHCTTGLRDIERSMTIYPNPADDILNINIFSDGFSSGSLAIVGIDGKTFIDRQLNLSGGMNSISLNTKELNPGLYYVRIKSAGFLSVDKVVIE